FQGLKLPVQSGAKDGYRTAIAIIGRVADKLVIDGGMHAFPDLNIVIRFDDFLQAIGQRSVAGKDSGAASSEEITVLAGDAVDRAGHAERVIWAIPKIAFDTHA